MKMGTPIVVISGEGKLIIKADTNGRMETFMMEIGGRGFDMELGSS